jgi:hypothetical protein
MRTRRAPLLAELHAHTTWSDGTLGIPELVDLAGVRGFDLLCITDHVVRDDDPWLSPSERATMGVLTEASPDAARDRQSSSSTRSAIESTIRDGRYGNRSASARDDRLLTDEHSVHVHEPRLDRAPHGHRS